MAATASHVQSTCLDAGTTGQIKANCSCHDSPAQLALLEHLEVSCPMRCDFYSFGSASCAECDGAQAGTPCFGCEAHENFHHRIPS